MLYAFYSRGYKGGGANPPEPGFGSKSVLDYAPQLEQDLIDQLTFYGNTEYIPYVIGRFSKPILSLTGVEYGRTFEPEFVNAFEVGAKNTLIGGALTANADIFLYDYKDYQVSQIRDRTAVNENFDAKVWGAEFEATFAPSRKLQFRGTLGYLDTRIGDGETSIDIMNRTQSNPDFVVVKPWMQQPSNCVVPRAVVERYLQHNAGIDQYWNLCGGVGTVLDLFNLPLKIRTGDAIVDPNNINPDTGNPRLYDPFFYDGTGGRPNIHGGAGIAADLGGKELPNAPHWTVSLGGQYTIEPSDAWKLTIRADTYWQSQSWARVYNAVNDKLHGWYNANLSVWVELPDQDLKIELYAKNVLNDTPITDAFINSDDTSLTTNVFVLDPRLIGLSIRKGF
jgi:outer membrane receptor protein involved in Fe transport